jgi:demethylsterigmatocystin 6-O-methyltransferase
MQSLTTYRFDNMAPAFLHMPTHFASTNYAEPTSQETSPYFQLFNRGFWDRVNASPKLKREFDTYMAAHKKGGSSLVDLLPLSRLVSGYNAAFPVLLVDIGGNVGHQCIELKTRYPDLQGGVVVQDLKCAEDLGAGVKGMEYDFFTPQPIKGKLHTLSSAFQKSQHP